MGMWVILSEDTNGCVIADHAGAWAVNVLVWGGGREERIRRPSQDGFGMHLVPGGPLVFTYETHSVRKLNPISDGYSKILHHISIIFVVI